MYYVYVLLNKETGRYYVGYTMNLRRRVNQHLNSEVKSTKSNLNYELVYYSAFEDRDLAVKFERYLKSGSGVAFMKKRLIKKFITRSPKGEV